MSVYIESVILDNFFITLLLSKLSYRAMSISKNRLRQMLAAALGTAVAVVYPLLSVPAIVLLSVKCALAVMLSLILFCKKCKMLPAAGIFIGLTFAFGGVLFALGYLAYDDIETALTVPLGSLPVGGIIAIAFLLYIPVVKILLKRKRVRDAQGFILRAEIEVGGQLLTGNAFLDTGNRLYDPKTSLPVIVLGAKASLRVLGDEGLQAVLSGKEPLNFKDAHYIPYSSVGQKNGKLLVVKPNVVRFYSGQSPHTIKEVMIGLSFSHFHDAVEYDILLHPAINYNEPELKLKKGSVPL